MKSAPVMSHPPPAVSPSARRVLVEIGIRVQRARMSSCHPPRGGCWLKCAFPDAATTFCASPSARRVLVEISGRGYLFPLHQSPSARRVLVEMPFLLEFYHCAVGHPPRGGCWLKSTPRLWQVTSGTRHPPRGGCWLKSRTFHTINRIIPRHPPRGGCWLKYFQNLPDNAFSASPSARRVLVEIPSDQFLPVSASVTLREEGVG